MRKPLAVLIAIATIPVSAYAQTNGFLQRAEKEFKSLSPENQLTVKSAVIDPKQIYIDEKGNYVTGETLLSKDVKPQETDAQLSQAMAKGKSAKENSSK